MPYLEIYPMENCANKIQKQLDEVISARPHMYSKTKRRYQELAISLLQSVEKITDILEADSLASVDSDEFDNATQLDVKDISDAVQQASNKVNKFQKFVSNPSATNSINRDTLARYAEVIEKAHNHSFLIEEANQCMSVIYKWFTNRFTPKVKNPEFRYNIAQIPEWITNIIILYGKYLKQDDVCSFIHMFDEWSNTITRDTSNIWAVPYEVHKLSKTVDPESYTLESVIIGDIMMDEMFYLLTKEHSPGLVCNLDCYPVASVVKLNNPNLLPKIRTRLAKRNQLIEECNLTISERSGTVE